MPTFIIKFKSFNKVKQPEKCSHWLLKSTNGTIVPKKRHVREKNKAEVKPSLLHPSNAGSLIPPLCLLCCSSGCLQTAATAPHTPDASASLFLDHRGGPTGDLCHMSSLRLFHSSLGVVSS